MVTSLKQNGGGGGGGAITSNAIEGWNYNVTLYAKTRKRVSILAPSSQSQLVFLMAL